MGFATPSPTMQETTTKASPLSRLLSAMKSLLSPPRVKRVRIG
jgi:hypothetical protein